VILIDANLLVYAHVVSFPHHNQAREWLDAQMSGLTRVGLPWASLLGFLRIVTNARVFPRPESIDSAWRQVQSWLDVEVAWIPSATERHREILGGLLINTGAQANFVPDAHLAALAVEHGLTVCSTDSDFGKFSGVPWQNPLSA
jgi:hypothetical protein